jgi:hypothetical protein
LLGGRRGGLRFPPAGRIAINYPTILR